jgi:high-affinity K+ transport system ATPase subunit B
LEASKHIIAQTIVSEAQLRGLRLAVPVEITEIQRDVAQPIAAGLPIDAVRSELSLAAADVGIAMGARGATASAEAADAVLLVDQLDRLLPAIAIARRSLFIARESVFFGIGLSVAGMIAAALGHITRFKEPFCRRGSTSPSF